MIYALSNGSMGALLSEAAGNLVIGMGSVFAVLIFLTWIISLFKHVAKLESLLSPEARAAKKAHEAQEAYRASHPKQKKKTEPIQKDIRTKANQDLHVGVHPIGAASSISAKQMEEEIAAVIAAAVAAYESETAVTAAPGSGAAAAGTAPGRPKQGALHDGIRIRSYKRG